MITKSVCWQAQHYKHKKNLGSFVSLNVSLQCIKRKGIFCVCNVQLGRKQEGVRFTITIIQSGALNRSASHYN